MTENATLDMVLDITEWDTLMCITMSIMCVVLLIIIVGNTLTIVAFIKFHHLQNARNCFVVSLAVADIIYGLVNIASLFYLITVTDHWTATCDKRWSSITPTLSYITKVLSFLHILAITADCYIYITKPLHYHRLMSPRRAKVIIAVIWVVSLLTGSVLFIRELYAAECKSTEILRMYGNLVKTILWAVIALTVTFMYLQIMCVVKKQQRQVQTLEVRFHSNTVNNDGRNTSQPQNTQKHSNRIFIVFCIITLFIVLWLPYIIITVSLAFYRQKLIYTIGDSTLAKILAICITIAAINSSVNVFIYARIEKDFRNAYKQILLCK